jgi:hypothetical protein
MGVKHTLNQPLDDQHYCLVLILCNVSPWMTLHYCAIFHFVHELQQINMLSDTDAACVASAVAICLKKKKKIHNWTKECQKQRPQYTHKNL